MEAFKRLENEDENAYIWRVCDNKDLIGTWQDRIYCFSDGL